MDVVEYAMDQDYDFAQMVVRCLLRTEETAKATEYNLSRISTNNDRSGTSAYSFIAHAIKSGVVTASVSLGWTLMHYAVHQGDTVVVEMLCGIGADVNAVTEGKSTPLHFAAERAYTEILMMLLTAGAGVDALDKDGRTPLHLAALVGHSEAVKVLITAGANIEATNIHGETILHQAVLGGHSNVVKTLLAAGMDVNAADSRGQTALHHWTLSAPGSPVQVLKILIEAGADVDAVDTDGNTAEALARYSHRTAVGNIFRRHRDKTSRRSVVRPGPKGAPCRYGTGGKRVPDLSSFASQDEVSDNPPRVESDRGKRSEVVVCTKPHAV